MELKLSEDLSAFENGTWSPHLYTHFWKHFPLGHSTAWCPPISSLSVTAHRSRTEWFTAITGLWNSPFLLLRTVPPVESRHVGRQWYVSVKKQRNLLSKEGAVVFSMSIFHKNWEVYKWIWCRGRDKLNEMLADLERSDVPLGQWSLFSCKHQDYKGKLQNC